ncbi:MAG: helix-hairpin-helix domain-containing protein [candidate division Zixibacteria bacterium]
MNRFFDFSPLQLRFLVGLTFLLLITIGFNIVKEYARPTEQAIDLPIILADPQDYVGLFIVDPNRSPADSLELLPGIGSVLADRIVEYRKEQRFETEIDITNIRGIGPRLYERIKPYLKVRRL